MLREALWRPSESDIQGSTHYQGDSLDLDKPVVGLALERDLSGYPRRILSSDDPPYIINGSSDVQDWLSTSDPRLLFTSDKCFLDSLIKWWGDAGLSGLDESGAWGLFFHLDKCIIRCGLEGDAFATYHRHTIKKVHSVIPFYHMYHTFDGEEDCFEVKQYAERLIHTLKDRKIGTVNLHSAGGIMQASLSYIKFQESSLPKEVLQYAANCYHTNWITAFQLGRFDKAYDYDISSAYPSRAMELQSCHPIYGSWKKSSLYQAEAEYGLCTAKLEMLSTSPILFRSYSHFDKKYGARAGNVEGIGKWEGFITKDEIDFIKEYELGKVTIQDGWWFFTHIEFHPFAKAMRDLFKMRAEANQAGDKFLANLAKVISVSLQGKFMSTFNQFGKLRSGYMRNPVYGAIITARTRIKDAEFALPHLDKLVGLVVDGCVLTDKVPLLGEGYGEMRLSSPPNGEECISVGDGEYWMPSRNSLFNPMMLEESYDKGSYKRPLIHKRFSRYADDWDMVGKLNLSIPSISLARSVRFSHRKFLEAPKACRDLLTNHYASVPKILGSGDSDDN